MCVYVCVSVHVNCIAALAEGLELFYSQGERSDPRRRRRFSQMRRRPPTSSNSSAPPSSSSAAMRRSASVSVAVTGGFGSAFDTLHGDVHGGEDQDQRTFTFDQELRLRGQTVPTFLSQNLDSDHSGAAKRQSSDSTQDHRPDSAAVSSDLRTPTSERDAVRSTSLLRGLSDSTTPRELVSQPAAAVDDEAVVEGTGATVDLTAAAQPQSAPAEITHAPQETGASHSESHIDQAAELHAFRAHQAPLTDSHASSRVKHVARGGGSSVHSFQVEADHSTSAAGVLLAPLNMSVPATAAMTVDSHVTGSSHPSTHSSQPLSPDVLDVTGIGMSCHNACTRCGAELSEAHVMSLWGDDANVYTIQYVVDQSSLMPLLLAPAP